MSPPPSNYDSVDTRALRMALGEYATGIAVVTAAGLSADAAPVGLTVNSFASVSLDPPLVLWSLSVNSPSLAAFQAASHFAVNVLAANQKDFSQRVAQNGTDKFAGLAWKVGAGGTALLDGCNAWFECRTEAQHPGGDHIIFIGRVERFERRAELLPPLLYHRSGYAEVSSAG